MQKLASLFYQAARKTGSIDPAKVEEILGLNEEEANAESTESGEAVSITDENKGSEAATPEASSKTYCHSERNDFFFKLLTAMENYSQMNLDNVPILLITVIISKPYSKDSSWQSIHFVIFIDKIVIKPDL